MIIVYVKFYRILDLQMDKTSWTYNSTITTRYESEYDNYRMTSDCESEAVTGEEGEGELSRPFNLHNIRQLSQNITNKFGNRYAVYN